MKQKTLTFLFIIFTLNLIGQSKQTKEFYVNSYELIRGEEEESKQEPLCEGFDVIISTDKINIGDEFDLTITKSEYRAKKNLTMYWVEDKAKSNKICYVVLATDSRGENYIQVHTCKSNGELIYEGGIIFKYWDYVSNYELWRYRRNNN